MIPPIIKYLLEPLVDNLDDVTVDQQTISEGQTEYTIFVPQDQIGHIIGKQGKTISSIRQVLKTHGHVTGKHLFLKVEEQPQAE